MQIHMHNSKNGTNHEETSCGMDRTVSKLSEKFFGVQYTFVNSCN